MPNPICFIVPGFLGSTLSLEKPPKDTIWANPSALALGLIGKMRLAPDGISPGIPDGEFLVPFTPLADYYEQMQVSLLAGLAQEAYEIIPWGYDFRLNIAFAGSELANYVIQLVDASKPCSIVAHSMGGLVARYAWFTLAANGNENLIRRIITLGTPHQGSYTPVDLFSGNEQTLTEMVFVSNLVKVILTPFGLVGNKPFWTPMDILILMGTWPGLYQLLPTLGSQDSQGDPNRPLLFQKSNWSNPSEHLGVKLDQRRSLGNGEQLGVRRSHQGPGPPPHGGGSSAALRPGRVCSARLDSLPAPGSFGAPLPWSRGERTEPGGSEAPGSSSSSRVRPNELDEPVPSSRRTPRLF